MLNPQIRLYLILIHHQTTTRHRNNPPIRRCISSLFITKPQLINRPIDSHKVVSHPYSSPNHNCLTLQVWLLQLYLILIHHQTTTLSRDRGRWCCCISSLFITKPQHLWQNAADGSCCISSLFITKPQLVPERNIQWSVVSHPYSSPNHNMEVALLRRGGVVSHPYSSPNHNSIILEKKFLIVVSHPYSSPNHNCARTWRNATHVVSHPYSSPNHNATSPSISPWIVVSHPYSSPNHNCAFVLSTRSVVVSHPYSSPNHNLYSPIHLYRAIYIQI